METSFRQTFTDNLETLNVQRYFKMRTGIMQNENEAKTESMFSRSELLLGKEYYKTLENKTVCIFGLGGVGGYAAEILARSGIGHFILVDGDVVTRSNLNRQILALNSTIGKEKCSVCKERLLEINPACRIELVPSFILPTSPELHEIFSHSLDYVLDAVDTITLKVALAKLCEQKNIPLISATGCGNRISADYEFADIYRTSHCPVCRVLRTKLKTAGVKKLKVLYSKSDVIKQNPVASVPWTPAIAGILLAEAVIMKLLALSE